ncbi:MAG: hypothetical protein K2O41_01880 [Clostridia bacterium]|nr:hypothetical protein [Clostridia bacterium]
MDNLNEKITDTADTAEAEKEEAAAVPKKFKDVKTLVKAYEDLEAEFTRRSTRLKELEKENKAQTPSDGAESAPSQLSEDELLNAALSSERVREAVIKQYLGSVSRQGAVPLLSGGGGVAAPRLAPKTVKDAGRLAQEFLNK